MFQIGFFTLCYNLLYSDWCLESSVVVRLVRLSEGGGQLASVPTDIGDFFGGLSS